MWAAAAEVLMLEWGQSLGADRHITSRPRQNGAVLKPNVG